MSIAALGCTANALAADAPPAPAVIAPIGHRNEAIVAQVRRAARYATRIAEDHVREAQRHVIEVEH